MRRDVKSINQHHMHSVACMELMPTRDKGFDDGRWTMGGVVGVMGVMGDR